MGDKPLSQAEIDSLLSGLAEKKAAALAKAKVATPAGAVSREASPPSTGVSPPPIARRVPPPVDAVSQAASPPSTGVSPPPIARRVPPPDATPPERGRVAEAAAESASVLQAKVLDLGQRLSKLETAMGRLERLEKGMADAQALPRELQGVMKRVQELSVEVKKISTKLQGTLGYDIYHGFKCDQCGTQGHVATAFRCTKCGHQSWRGWWPKK